MMWMMMMMGMGNVYRCTWSSTRIAGERRRPTTIASCAPTTTVVDVVVNIVIHGLVGALWRDLYLIACIAHEQLKNEITKRGQ
jgi:hypothetical protein